MTGVTYNEDIILKNVDLIPTNNRGHFHLAKSDMSKITAWMVVFYLKELIFLRTYFLNLKLNTKIGLCTHHSPFPLFALNKIKKNEIYR